MTGHQQRTAPREPEGFPYTKVVCGMAALFAFVVTVVVMFTGRKDERPAPRNAPPVLPAPKVEKRPTPEDVRARLEQKALAALERVGKVRSRKPADLLATLRAVETVARKYSDTEAGKTAAGKVAELRFAIDDCLSKVSASATESVEKARFGEARNAYRAFLHAVPEDPWKTSARRALIAVEKAAMAHEKLLAERKRAKLETVLAEARRETLDLIGNGSVARIIAAYKRLQSDPRFSTARNLISDDLRLFRKLQWLLDSAESGAYSRIGKMFSAHGITGTIAGAGGGEIRIDSGGEEFTRKILALRVSEILDLAGVEEAGSEDPLSVAALHMWRGETEQAEDILAGLEKKGSDVRTYISLVGAVKNASREN